IVDIAYDRAIVPAASYQDCGVEDARISRAGDRWLMTACSVSAERLGTSLYSSADGRDWTLEGLILDHQNKDMLIFEGQIGGHYWAQTRPLGETWFAYPPDSEYRAGPSINLASSPDALHWRPRAEPGIRPHSATVSTARMGGGTPPVLVEDGWLTLWHGVAPGGDVGIYRTYWSILDAKEPWRVVRTDHAALLEPMPELPAALTDRAYLSHVVFTTGIADAGDDWLVASGEADLACRMSRIPKARFA
ncbi:MAG: glycosidase, partial [Sphingomonadales bacterium]